jgi:hypothetical protein
MGSGELGLRAPPAVPQILSAWIGGGTFPVGGGEGRVEVRLYGRDEAPGRWSACESAPPRQSLSAAGGRAIQIS